MDIITKYLEQRPKAKPSPKIMGVDIGTIDLSQVTTYSPRIDNHGLYVGGIDVERSIRETQIHMEDIESRIRRLEERSAEAAQRFDESIRRFEVELRGI